MASNQSSEEERKESLQEIPTQPAKTLTVADLKDTPDRKKELLKVLLIAVTAFTVFMVFNYWPSIYTAVFGVLTIVSVAMLTEWLSVKVERLPYKTRAVVITGCETGLYRIIRITSLMSYM